MVSCILTMIIMYKFNYTNETVSGLLRDEIHVPIYKKKYSYALKVQIMIEMYICTFDLIIWDKQSFTLREW